MILAPVVFGALRKQRLAGAECPAVLFQRPEWGWSGRPHVGVEQAIPTGDSYFLVWGTALQLSKVVVSPLPALNDPVSMRTSCEASEGLLAHHILHSSPTLQPFAPSSLPASTGAQL